MTTRAPYSNGDSQPTPDAFAAIPSPPLSVPAWGPSAPKWGPDGSIAAPAVESIASAAASDWGNATEVSTTATIGWGDEVPDETGKGEEIDRPETPIARAVLNDGWGDAATPEVESVVESAKLRQPSKIVVPGSKISWAQITRYVLIRLLLQCTLVPVCLHASQMIIDLSPLPNLYLPSSSFQPQLPSSSPLPLLQLRLLLPSNSNQSPPSFTKSLSPKSTRRRSPPLLLGTKRQLLDLSMPGQHLLLLLSVLAPDGLIQSPPLPTRLTNNTLKSRPPRFRLIFLQTTLILLARSRSLHLRSPLSYRPNMSRMELDHLDWRNGRVSVVRSLRTIVRRRLECSLVV